MTTPSLPMIIAMINSFSSAIIDDSASDSTLDLMQFDIDCILFSNDIDDIPLDERDYSPLIIDPLSDSPSLDAIRAYANAAYSLRP